MEHIDFAISIAKKHLRDLERLHKSSPFSLCIASLKRYKCAYLFQWWLSDWNRKVSIGVNPYFIVDVENNAVHEIEIYHDFEFQMWLYCRYRDRPDVYYRYIRRIPRDKQDRYKK